MAYRRRRYRRKTWRSRRRPARRFGRRTLRRRRSGFRRRSYRRGGSMSKKHAIFTFKAENEIDFTPSSITPTSGSIAFDLNDSSDALFLSGMYNRFRIKSITIKISPKHPPGTVIEPMIAIQDNINAACDRQEYPVIWIRRDYEDSIAPAGTEDAFRNCKGTFRINYNQTKTFKLRPAILTMAYEGAVTTAYSPAWNKWIWSSDPDTQHFGLKWYMPAINAYFDRVYYFNGGWRGELWYTVEFAQWERGT